MVVVQKYRLELLYEGPHDDEAAFGMYVCNVTDIFVKGDMPIM